MLSAQATRVSHVEVIACQEAQLAAPRQQVFEEGADQHHARIQDEGHRDPHLACLREALLEVPQQRVALAAYQGSILWWMQGKREDLKGALPERGASSRRRSGVGRKRG